MSRLIDADALKQGFESSDFDDDPFENVDNACRIVNSCPTIPAIPVEWLRERKHWAAIDGDHWAENIIGYLLKAWQDEQEASV